MISKDMFLMSCRLNTLFVNFIAASTAINLVTNDETPMGQKLKSKIYVNDRCPGKVKFVNTAKTRIGENKTSVTGSRSYNQLTVIG